MQHRRGGVYPRPTNSGQDTKQISRSCEDGDKPRPYGGCVQHIDYQNVANVTYVCVHYHFAGRPLWPSGRSKDRISVASVCFEGFPLCQHQDPTEEDLPDKRLKPLVLTQRVLLVLVLIYDCLFNRSSFKGVTLPMLHPKSSIFLVSA